MNPSVLTILLVISFSLNTYDCEEYVGVKLEDIVVEFVNGTYFDADTFDISLNYHSDTANNLGMNIDIIEDLPKDIALKLKVWDYAFGQYNVPTGVSIDMYLCNDKLRDYFFKTIFIKMGFGDECPPPKGKYQNDGFDSNLGGLPVHFLPGFRLLLEAEAYASNMILVKANSYLQVL